MTQVLGKGKRGAVLFQRTVASFGGRSPPSLLRLSPHVLVRAIDSALKSRAMISNVFRAHAESYTVS